MSGSATLLSGILKPPDPLLATQVASWVEASASSDASVVSAVVAIVAKRRGVEVEMIVDGKLVAPAPNIVAMAHDEAVVDRWGPWLPGLVREALTSDEQRHGRGVHHTPPQVVSGVLDAAEAAGLTWNDNATVLDPSVGGGAFLLAAAQRLGGDPASVVQRLYGVDIDPLAVATTVAALTLWAGVAPDPGQFQVGDFLHDPVSRPRTDIVVGNPPFLSQLRGDTVRDDAARAALAQRWPGVGGYVDDAMAFLLAAMDVTADGGFVVMVLPASVLSARDAKPARQWVDQRGSLRALWVDDGRAFSAGVDTVAAVIERGETGAGEVRVGETMVERPSPTSWAPLLAAASGVPVVDVAHLGTLSDIASPTAGFRDQFYGLRGAVAEGDVGQSDAGLALMTSGSIDPLTNRWGARTTRFDKVSYRRPVVDLDQIDESVQAWFRKRLVPKVLVASQTKMIEAVVDVEATMIPCTPVVSVEPFDATDLWRVAALLTSPVATALLRRDGAGSALSAGAVRVTATALGQLPLPTNRELWDRAAALASQSDVEGCGQQMLAAYGLEHRDDVLAWWKDLIPTSLPGI